MSKRLGIRSESGRDLKTSIVSNRRLILLSIGIYLVGGALGLFAGTATDVVQLGQTAGDASTVDRFQASATTLELLRPNLIVTLLLFAGLLTFGATTVFFLFANGLFHFYQMVLLPLDTVELVVFFVPHGVLELPALWLAGAAGFKVPFNLIAYLQEDRDGLLRSEEVTELAHLVVLSLSLLLVGAVVEAEITPRLATLL